MYDPSKRILKSPAAGSVISGVFLIYESRFIQSEVLAFDSEKNQYKPWQLWLKLIGFNKTHRKVRATTINTNLGTISKGKESDCIKIVNAFRPNDPIKGLVKLDWLYNEVQEILTIIKSEDVYCKCNINYYAPAGHPRIDRFELTTSVSPDTVEKLSREKLDKERTLLWSAPPSWLEKPYYRILHEDNLARRVGDVRFTEPPAQEEAEEPPVENNEDDGANE